MVFLLAYAVAIWAVALVYRRRWPSFAAVVGGLSPVALLAVYFAEFWAGDRGVVVYGLAGGYMALILGVGLLIAVQPRPRPAHPCRACHYDLAGSRGERCPECGFDLSSTKKRPRPPRHAAPAARTPEVSLATQLATASAWRERAHESARPSPVTMSAPASAAAATRPQ